MTCEKCQEAATVHLTDTVDGSVREVHLCGACARKAGIPTPRTKLDLSLDTVLDILISAHVGELVGELAQRTCPICDLKFMEYRTGGRLGCPHDYQVFQAGLLPSIARSQTATRHVGKRPRRGSKPAPTERQLRLRSDLRRAIAREDYEDAARLRDLIRPKDSES